MIPRVSEPDLFRTHVVDVTELGALRDTMLDMYEGRADLLIVKNVFTPEAMARIVARLETLKHLFPLKAREHEDTSVKQMFVMGHSITPSGLYPNGPEPMDYYAAAAKFRESCRELFSTEVDFETRLQEVFEKLSSGRKVEVPPGPNGATYTPATIRYLPEGIGIPIHSGLEFVNTSMYEHLGPLLDKSDQLSYFVVMTKPPAGGELEVWKLQSFSPDIPRNAKGYVDLDTVSAKFPSTLYAPEPGDLLLFDGGRWYHRVRDAQGGPRRTIGGFACFTKDRDKVYYWG